MINGRTSRLRTTPVNRPLVVQPSSGVPHLSVILKMKKSHFSELVELATERTRRFSTEFVTNRLPEASLYLLHVTQSYPNLKESEITIPEKGMPIRAYKGPLTKEDVVDELWIEGRIPVWIDLQVYEADDQHTYYDLYACNRFSGNEEDYYYSEPGIGPSPFGQKSPSFPFDWNESKGKFDLDERVEMFGHLRKSIG